MAVKMAVVDLDGTALKTDKSISKSTIEAFKKLKENNIITAIATGRLENESMFVKEALGVDYMITANGSIVYDYTKEHLIYEDYITNENAIKILDAIAKHKGSFVLTFLNTVPYCIVFDSMERTKANLINTELSRGYIETFSKYFKYTDDYALLLSDKNHKIHKICLDTIGDNNALNEIKNEIKSIENIKIIKVFQNVIDIIHLKVDKGLALQKLASYLNIDIKDTMAIGDGYNDIEMIRDAGIGIAMGNAADEIKAVSDYIVASNNEDGIFEAIDKYVFNAN